MSDVKTLTFYLQPSFRESAETGQVNFINRVVSAFANCGYKSAFRNNSDLELAQSAARPGYSMFHMEDPFHDRALTMRLAYFYPFWRIENASERWKWKVATTAFEPDAVDPFLAEKFVTQWKRRLYRDDATTSNLGSGYVYIPLQGCLLEHRSFQSMSPIEMIRATLEGEKSRRICATLHPKEKYDDAELSAIRAMEKQYPRFSVVAQETDSLVQGCDYIVTQNSGIALQGFFHNKPAILFAKIDFHHIALNVHDFGAESAFARIDDHRPDYERYLFWFLQKMSINAGRDNAEQKILRTVRSRGWGVK